MFQPSPAARPKKRTAPKVTLKPAHTAKARAGKSLPAAAPLPPHSPYEARLIGHFVRRAADRILAQICEEAQELRGLLLATDGELQCGFHTLRSAVITLDQAIANVNDAIAATKARGERGHEGDD